MSTHLKQAASLSAATDELHPNERTITRFLSELCDPWYSGNHFHFRFLSEGFTPSSTNFAPHAWDEMIEHVLKMNRTHNVYVCPNPIPDGSSIVACDRDIREAHFAFVDADDVVATKMVREFQQFVMHMEVITGTVPFDRVHHYYKFDEPITDMAQWRQLQSLLIDRLKTDASIKNPSRIMRVAGTVSYPSKDKLQKGYVPELTRLKIGGEYVE